MADVLLRWREALLKTSTSALGRLAGLLGTTEINAGTWDELEGVLIQADIGVKTTQALIIALKQDVKDQSLTRADQLRSSLRIQLRSRIKSPLEMDLLNVRQDINPVVILIVGVNGSGKTTTIAKLGRRLVDDGKTVLFGAADTFRAAAVDQLQIWGERLKIDVIAGSPEGDAGAVAFNTIQAGIARNVDVILIDTAGRMHTRFNLMEELKKVHRVIGKALPGAPHAVWLVLDATTGQNALQQARAFKEAVRINGVILSKLDSSAHGGMAFAIQEELGLPILFAGLGEKAEDLQIFNPDAFIDGILPEGLAA